MHTNVVPDPARESLLSELANATDEVLGQALEEQRRGVAAAEQAFAEARARLDEQRQGLRRLEAEQQRRQGVRPSSPDRAASPSGARKRSTTVVDAINGRDNLDAGAALRSFRFLSLQREEVILAEAADPDQQAIRFLDKDTGEEHLAQTFAEARTLLESGHAPGQPGIPLQRQVVWNVERGRTVKLRLDQMFVERRGDKA